MLIGARFGEWMPLAPFLRTIPLTFKEGFTMTDGKSRRGFASMSPEKRREIARLGGKAAHQKGRAHQFTSTEAREAGRKGGLSVSKNRLHMAEIGRAGGKARGQRTNAPAPVLRFPPQAIEQALS